MAFIGGIGHFCGPIIGAVLVTLLQSALSNYTQAWLLYFGLFFLVDDHVRAGRDRQPDRSAWAGTAEPACCSGWCRATCGRARRWPSCWPDSSRWSK